MESLNIEKIGPGAWYLIHMFAANAKTEETIKAFHILIKIVSEKFFCLRCRDHFSSNLYKFPPPLVNKYNELFIWTVEMHNRVNAVNSKPLVSYRDALNYYIGPDATCHGDCHGQNGSAGNLSMPEILLKVLSGSGESMKFPTNSHLSL